MRAHGFATAAMVSFVAVPAAAGNPCVVLELTAPAECPTAATIEQTVTELVHNVPSTPLAARATIAKQGERYTVTLVTAAGERTFDGETCQGAADALTVILALAVDPNASTTPPATTAEAAPTEPQPAPTSPAAPAAPVVPVAPAAPVAPQPKSEESEESEESEGPPARSEPMTLGGSLFALLDSGLLPGVGVGAVGSVRVNAGRVSGEFSGRFLLPRSTNIEGDPNRGGTFNWVGAGLEACLRVLPPLHTCFGAEVGGLTGEGIGVDTPFTRTATMVDLTGGAVGRVDIGSDFALEARLGVAVPMDRPQFGLEGFGDLHQPDSVSLRAGFGVAFR